MATLNPSTADVLSAVALLSGVVIAVIVVAIYVRTRMTRQDWADAMRFNGPARPRFFRVHGIRLIVLLAALFVWIAVVGTFILPLIEAATVGRV